MKRIFLKLLSILLLSTSLFAIDARGPFATSSNISSNIPDPLFTTIGTAAQPNITSLGTIAALSAGTGSFSGVTSLTNNTAASVGGGALVVTGGTWTGGQAWFAGSIYAYAATDSSSTSTGAIHTDGGLGIQKKLYVGGTATVIGQTYAAAATESTSTTTGSFRCDGGVGIQKRLNVGGLATFAGAVSVAGLTKHSQATKDAAYTASTEEYLFCDATGGAFSITLPAVSAGLQYTIKKTDASANAVTISGNAAETIDGELTQALTTQYDVITIVGTATEWFTL